MSAYLAGPIRYRLWRARRRDTLRKAVCIENLQAWALCAKLERRGWPILKQREGVIQLCYTWLASGQWPKQRGVTSTCCWTLFPTWTFCLHLESWPFICPTYYLDLMIHLNIAQSTCWCDWPPLQTCLMPKPMLWLACISLLYFGRIWAKAIEVRAEGLKCSWGERSQQIPRRILM